MLESDRRLERRRVLVLDRRKVMEMAMGDRALLHRLVELFREYYPSLLTSIEERLQAGDLPQVAEMAHRLKGSISTFYAQPATEAARDVERAARDANADRTAAALENLQAEVATLDRAIDEWLIEMSTADHDRAASPAQNSGSGNRRE